MPGLEEGVLAIEAGPSLQQQIILMLRLLEKGPHGAMPQTP